MNSGNGGKIIQESGSESMEDRDKADLERIEKFRTAKANNLADGAEYVETGIESTTYGYQKTNIESFV